MKLKLFKETPPNGLAIYNGSYEFMGKVIKVNSAFEPPKPITRALYHCGDRFHTEHLREQLRVGALWAIIIVDGKGACWFALDGQTKTKLHKVDVDLPPKHGRGGQSANRFARLREERRLWYIKKVMEISERVLIGDNHLVNYEGIILAGCADLKNDLYTSQFLDQRIKNKIVKVVDVQYGGEPGLNEVLIGCEDLLKNQKMYKEIQTLSHFFGLIASDGLCTFTIEDTLFALEGGAVETLIISEGLTKQRIKLIKKQKDETEESCKILFKDPDEDFEKEINGDSNLYKVAETSSLLEYVLETYKSFGATKVDVISADTQEGTQFLRAFQGIGAILRYRVELPSEVQDLENEDHEADDPEILV